MSLRCARSPDPPKMTIVDGSGMRESRSPSRSGFRVDVASSRPPQSRRYAPETRSGLAGSLVARRSLFLLQGVAAELIPERGGDLHRIAVLLPRHEAREQ